jgi:hypothetical protein
MPTLTAAANMPADDNAIDTTESDEKGRYAFAGIEPDLYMLQAPPNGVMDPGLA